MCNCFFFLFFFSKRRRKKRKNRGRNIQSIKAVGGEIDKKNIKEERERKKEW